MPYIFVEDFKYGMDRRRPRYAGVPGTLWDGENVHLSRGGDVERAKKFVATYTDLENTFGLADLGGLLYVFGSADLAGSMPNGVQYQRLQAPSTPAMTQVLDVQRFDNKLYVIADYDDGNRYHFYDGTRVAHWDTLSAALASTKLTYEALAEIVAGADSVTVQPKADGITLTASVPGVAFTASSTHTNGGAGVNDQTSTDTVVQANVAAVAAVEAEADLTITGGSFDPGVNALTTLKVGATEGTAIDLIGGPVNYVSSDSATANAIAVAVNDRTDEHGYVAAAVGSTVTITAIPGSGTTANAYSLYPAVSGDLTTSGTSAFSGGVNATAAVAQIVNITFGGTFEAADLITVTVDGTAYKMTGLAAATGSRAYVRANRMFSIAGPALYYCKLNDPADWTDVTANTGAGRVVISTDSDGSQRLIGVETYQTFTAIFAEKAVSIYTLGTDSAQFERIQELPNTGTIAGGAVRAYGANDLFYLDTTGVRSLQARDSSNSAMVSDAGTAFDPYVQQVVAAATARQLYDAVSVIEPQTGSYWLAIGGNILVLTNYPGTSIRGWTRYSPGFSVQAFVRTINRVLARDVDTIYIYGGASGTVYPDAGELAATVKLPFMTARDDAGFKHLMGFDFGAQNEWRVTALVNPNDETQTVDVGRLTGCTYVGENTEQVHETTHVAYEFVCDEAGFASISNLAAGHSGRLRA